MWISFAVFLSLALLNDRAALSYALSPAAFDAASAARALAGAFLAVASATLLSLGLKAAGRAFLRRLLAGENRPSWLGPIELAAGLALSVPVLLALGLLGLYSPASLRVLAAVLAAAGTFEGTRLLRSWTPRSAFASWSPPEAVVAGLLAFCAFESLCRGLAPPIDIDALKDHLALPELYLQSGRVMDIPWNIFSHWPQAVDLLYGLPLALGREEIAALLHGSFCLAVIFCVYQAAREEFGAEAAPWAAALLAVQPLFVAQAGGAMTDGALTLLFFAASLSLWRWRTNGSARWALAGGLLAGGAAAVKLQGLLLLALLCSWVLWRAARGGARERKGAAGFAAAAALIAAPWYLKAWAATGNPVWPFLPDLFEGAYGAPLVVASFHVSPFGGLLDAGTLRFMLLGDGAIFLLIPAAAVAASGLGRRAAWPPLLSFLLGPFPAYLLLVSNSISAWRYCLPFFPALALLFGWGATAGGLRALRCSALALALVPVLGLTQSNSLFPILGLRSRRWPQATPRLAFLRASLTFQPMREILDSSLRSGDRVLLFGDDQVFGLRADFMFGEPYYSGLLRWHEYAGPDDLASAMSRLGVTHVSINRSGDWRDASLRRIDPVMTSLLDATLARRATPLAEAGGRVLYRLNP